MTDFNISLSNYAVMRLFASVAAGAYLGWWVMSKLLFHVENVVAYAWEHYISVFFGKF